MAMANIVNLLLLVALASAGGESSSPPNVYPLGDVRNCPMKNPQNGSRPFYRMEVLPGIGFDNLRNLDMGQVHAYNFSTCQVSNDGKFLLPDSVFLIPVQASEVEMFAEYFDHWDEHTSITSNSINVEGGFHNPFSTISGKFSAGYSHMKLHMATGDEQSKSTRIQIRNKRYTIKLQPGAMLHPTFKSRIYDIAASIQSNRIGYAHYLAELIIRDYGTHYVSTIDTGAVLSKVDFISSSVIADKSLSKTEITASASVDFFGIFSMSSKFQHTATDSDTSVFKNKRTYSEIITAGGPPFTPNLTLIDWENGVDNALVAIDRSGDPLHFVINPTTLPQLPESTVESVAEILHQATNQYYKVNTRPGCTNPDSENFNFNANLNDSTCKRPLTGFNFGGMFQSCNLDPANKNDLCADRPSQRNPLTGRFSCPTDYTQALLHSGHLNVLVSPRKCHWEHRHCGTWNLHRCASYKCIPARYDKGSYDTYWCAAVNQTRGYLFGGFYSSKMSNPVTGSMTCPVFFTELHMGEDIKVCVSTDFERGYEYAVDFAGFESCSMGNPLADLTQKDNNEADWPHRCPYGYAQHLVYVEDGCEINVCVRTGAFSKPNKLIPPKLPPFHRHPKYDKNETSFLAGANGEVWAKDKYGMWDPSQLDERGFSGGSVAVISILSTIVLGLVVGVIAFVGRRAVKKRKQKKKDLEERAAGSGDDDEELIN